MGKNKKIIFIIIVVLVAVVGGCFYYLNLYRNQKQIQVAKTDMKVSLVRSDNSIKVYLSSNLVDTKPTLSAFQLHLTTTLPGDNYTLKLNPILENQGWTFPLVKKEGLSLKISGFRLGSTTYEINESGILLFTLSNNDNKNIDAKIVDQDTLFYGSDAQTLVTYQVFNQ